MSTPSIAPVAPVWAHPRAQGLPAAELPRGELARPAQSPDGWQWQRRYAGAAVSPLLAALPAPEALEPPVKGPGDDPLYTVTYDRIGGKRLRYQPLGPGAVGEFDASYGYTLKDLLQVRPPEPPADFAGFWAWRHAKAMLVPPKPTLQRLGSIGSFDLYAAYYDGVDGKRLGGYLALPRNGTIDNGVVSIHGYGGRDVPTERELARYSPTSAVLFPFVRGFGLSADADVPAASDQHVIHGIDSRETYEIGNSVSDVWSATNALLAIAPHARGRLVLEGGSFGGGVGTMALAWDNRFTKAFFEVPTFGHQELRMSLQTYGSGRAVQDYIARTGDREKVLRTLSYFDAASAARFVRTPTMIAAGLSDAAVAPPGQFAIYNALGSPKELLVMSAGHAELPEAEAQSHEAQRRAWLGF